MDRLRAWVSAALRRAGGAPLGVVVLWILLEVLLGPAVGMSVRDVSLHGALGIALARFFAWASRCEESEFLLGPWTRAKGFGFTLGMSVASVLGWEVLKATSDRLGWTEFQRGAVVLDGDVGISILGALGYLIYAVGTWPQDIMLELERMGREDGVGAGLSQDSVNLPLHSIGFDLEDPTRFPALAGFVGELAKAKESNHGDRGGPGDADRWERLLDEGAKSALLGWDQDPRDSEEADLGKPGRWPLGALVQAFMDGEYDLRGAFELDEEHARAAGKAYGIEYSPWAWPFGGTACMHALIRAFGGRGLVESSSGLTTPKVRRRPRGREFEVPVEHTLSKLPAGGQGIEWSVGPGPWVHRLTCLGPVPADEGPASATEGRHRSNRRLRRFRVVRDSLEGDPPRSFEFEDRRPLTEILSLGEECLVVAARCGVESNGEFEHNALVVGPDGDLRRSFTLGDGIAKIHAVGEDELWVAYFDEGIFGSGVGREPLGASGLVAWSTDGEKRYELEPPADEGPIADCYASTVDREGDVWCCAYDGFSVLRIHDHGLSGVWDSVVEGSNFMAVDAPYVLFYGDYDDRYRVHLIELLPSGGSRSIQSGLLVDPEGEPLEFERVFTRGTTLWGCVGTRVYRVEIEDLIRAWA